MKNKSEITGRQKPVIRINKAKREEEQKWGEKGEERETILYASAIKREKQKASVQCIIMKKQKRLIAVRFITP